MSFQSKIHFSIQENLFSYYRYCIIVTLLSPHSICKIIFLPWYRKATFPTNCACQVGNNFQHQTPDFAANVLSSVLRVLHVVTRHAEPHHLVINGGQDGHGHRQKLYHVAKRLCPYVLPSVVALVPAEDLIDVRTLRQIESDTLETGYLDHTASDGLSLVQYHAAGEEAKENPIHNQADVSHACARIATT